MIASSFAGLFRGAGCKERHVLAHKSFQLALKPFLISRIDYYPSVIWIAQKNSTCPLGKLRTKITSPIAKSTSPGLLDMTFFARWGVISQLLLYGRLINDIHIKYPWHGILQTKYCLDCDTLTDLWPSGAFIQAWCKGVQPLWSIASNSHSVFVLKKNNT